VTRHMEPGGTHHGHQAKPPHDAQIVVVDDQESNLRLLEIILQDAGYTRLVSTTSPYEALSVITGAQPDLILLDLIMPGMDGFQLMEHLKPLIPNEDYLPILVLTGDVNRETRRRALLSGATDFLTKPFDPTEVQLRINNLLHTRFLHLEMQRQNRALEEKVRDRTEQLTRTLHEVIGAQETERRRLSMDIHDGPLQSLGACTMAVDRIIRRHELGEHALVLHELRELRSSLDSTIADIRSVLADLSLEILSSNGLAQALCDYISRFSGLTGIDVKVNLDDAASVSLSPQAQLLLYRLAQEAFSNVRKHAHANVAEVSLEVKGDDLYMSISDDGLGFDVDAALQEHHTDKQLGLRSMRERLERAQGELWIQSEKGKGTTLTFRYPLSVSTVTTEAPPTPAGPPGTELAEEASRSRRKRR
jgi:two-component system sensor histidine kinase/response regulator